MSKYFNPNQSSKRFKNSHHSRTQNTGSVEQTSPDMNRIA
uniref:Uncharacterized protein n=1 Tax=Anguilla anguilla TaxID=7936 RepID=A0A0E9WBW4_ANGAN